MRVLPFVAITLTLGSVSTYAISAETDNSPLAGMRSYQQALGLRRLGAHLGLSKEDIRGHIAEAELLLDAARVGDAVTRLSVLVAHPNFSTFQAEPDGLAAQVLLGTALARSGANSAAIALLVKTAAEPAAWAAQGAAGPAAVRDVVDIALKLAAEGELELLRDALRQLEPVARYFDSASNAELAYLRGRLAEADGTRETAVDAYAKLPQTSRHWAQAVYRQGLIAVADGKLKQGEDLFCKVADPKRQQRTLPLFADAAFFNVRDMARLALGRVAHEQERQDDARYYYYLVPQDSIRLPEALYESATTRYEKKDYEGARELLTELAIQDRDSAYSDLASCKFADADLKLKRFIDRYEPMRKQVANLRSAAQPLRALNDGVTVGLSTRDGLVVEGALGRDPALVAARRRLASLDEQLSTLLPLRAQADGLANVLVPGAAPLTPPGRGVGPKSADLDDLQRELRAARRDLDALRLAGAPGAVALQLLVMNLEVSSAHATATATASERQTQVAPATASLDAMLRADGLAATSLHSAMTNVRTQTQARADALALSALTRLDARLSRLLRRARLARIESILGLKRGLELEVEAISAGYLPKDAIDSVAAERFLSDREEYWPFEGDDWADEFVGTEEAR
jgi:hypothetical protein